VYPRNGRIVIIEKTTQNFFIVKNFSNKIDYTHAVTNILKGYAGILKFTVYPAFCYNISIATVKL
jgi:hypothetical protein